MKAGGGRGGDGGKGAARGKGGRVPDAELEALGAAVFGVAAEGVAAGEAVAAEGAFVVSSLQMDLSDC